MISSVMSAQPLETSQHSLQESPVSTREKTKKLALLFFSGLFFIGGFSTVSFSLVTTLFTTIPCFVAAGIFMWAHNQIKDYSNPYTLKRFQEKAKNAPLQKTVKEHGWENIIKYNLISPADFPNLYLKAVEEMTLSELVKFYNMMEPSIRETNYLAPLPSQFQSKWDEETKGLTSCEIFAHYTPKEMILFEQYELITEEFKQASDTYRQYDVQKIQADFEANNNYTNNLKESLRNYKDVIDKAQATTVEHIKWLRSLKKEITTLQNSLPGDWPTLSLFSPPEEVGADLTDAVRAHKAFFTNVCTQNSLLKESLIKNHQAFKQDCEVLDQRFQSGQLVGYEILD